MRSLSSLYWYSISCFCCSTFRSSANWTLSASIAPTAPAAQSKAQVFVAVKIKRTAIDSTCADLVEPVFRKLRGEYQLWHAGEAPFVLFRPARRTIYVMLLINTTSPIHSILPPVVSNCAVVVTLPERQQTTDWHPHRLGCNPKLNLSSPCCARRVNPCCNLAVRCTPVLSGLEPF